MTKVAQERQGIQSIEVGCRLLNALAVARRPMMLRDLAAAAGMPPAKAHRYLVSFMRTGLVEQDSATGRYDLGGFALELGLSSLGRLEPVRFAGPFLEELCEQIHQSVALAVWGNSGATIVRIIDTGDHIAINLRAGNVLPTVKSATGKLFAAYCRSPAVRKLINDELHATATKTKIAVTTLRRQLEQTLTEIRARGLARAVGSLTAGINGFSAPVFDHSGSIVAAITSLGSVGEFNVEWDSPFATATKEAALELSRRLGYGGMADIREETGAPARNRTKT
ncbi:MAG: IclR family transcriptional regulator [Betaproteobacteria bacterium]